MDQVSVGQLAQSVTTILAPFLPYLVKGGLEAGKAAAGKLGEKFTEAGWQRATQLWGKLRPQVEARPGANEVIEAVVKAPQDQTAITALQFQVRAALAANAALADEVQQLIVALAEKPGNISMATAPGAVSIGGSANGANISTRVELPAKQPRRKARR